MMGGSPHYSVVNGSGALVARGLMPAGRVITGFGPKGVEYMGVRDGIWTRLEYDAGGRVSKLFLAGDGNEPDAAGQMPHRLDKQTSGLIVVVKTALAHRRVSADFMKKRVEKRYLALVDGIVEKDEGTIEAPIGRFAELKQWSVKVDGKHSESRFWVRERYADTTLIELEPVTGRTNQLRIHCELIGHPIVGDTQRGGREFERLCLHAYKLAFRHPISREDLSFESDQCPFPGP